LQAYLLLFSALWRAAAILLLEFPGRVELDDDTEGLLEKTEKLKISGDVEKNVFRMANFEMLDGDVKQKRTKASSLLCVCKIIFRCKLQTEDRFQQFLVHYF
jgi:hypothetical protein